MRWKAGIVFFMSNWVLGSWIPEIINYLSEKTVLMMSRTTTKYYCQSMVVQPGLKDQLAMLLMFYMEYSPGNSGCEVHFADWNSSITIPACTNSETISGQNLSHIHWLRVKIIKWAWHKILKDEGSVTLHRQGLEGSVLFHQVGLDPRCSWSFYVVVESGCVPTGGGTPDTLYS